MFSSYNHLKRKTPEQGIDRQEFIEHLVEEYYTTTNVEAQEQVTANLANFAYDPINWQYLKKSKALKLFIELLEAPNEILQLHGSAGLSNICLDYQTHLFIVKTKNIKIVEGVLLTSRNVNIILNILTLYYQLLSYSQSIKNSILSATILKKIKDINRFYESDKRIINISSLILEDFGKRYEFLEVGTISLPNSKMSDQKDLDNFSSLTNDFNYIHTEAVPPQERKVHGALLNAIVAGIIGTQFPGAGSIVLEQTLLFPRPCRIEVDCEFQLKLQQDRKISIITYECKQDNHIVFKGQAKLLTPSNK